MRRPAIDRPRLLHLFRIALVVSVILIGAALVILAARWPFTRQATIQSFEQVSSSEVQIVGFREIFFPSPGYIAQQVTFRRDHRPGARPIATIAKINCRTSWPALITFTHRVSRMNLEGVQIYVPAHVSPPVRRHPEPLIKTTVTELSANGTVLEIAPRQPGGQTVRFEFPKLTLNNLARNKAIELSTVVRNPTPKGDLAVSGTVGPLMLGKIADMPIVGTYQFRHADLSSFKDVAGDLSADGQFKGTVGRAEVIGTARIPNFEVTSSRHSLGLSAEYRATVDGTSGDVILQSAQAHFLGTTLIARGSITGRKGKTVSLDFVARPANVQDVLRLFVTSDRPPLDGPIAFTAHVVLPPERRTFLKRVQLDGDFTITHAEFTSATTQEKVNQLSARARGDKNKLKSQNGPGPVVSDWQARVKLRDAIASLSAALFAVPGAVAEGGGTYDLTNHAIDLRGKLAMHASLSKATTGIKSVLLTPLDPLFKKNGAGAVLSVRVSGTYSHPVFKVSLKR